MLVAFCGKMGSGKDTFGAQFKKLYPDAVKMSFAGPLKMELSSFIYCLKNDIGNVKTVYNINQKTLDEVLEIIGGIENVNSINIKHKDARVRKLLQYWGGMRRSQDSDYWIKAMKNNIKSEPAKNIYITDARFLNEFKAVKELGGILIFLDTDIDTVKKRVYKRDGIIPSEEALNDVSEKECELYNDYDYVINTSSIQKKDIKKKLKQILEKENSAN